MKTAIQSTRTACWRKFLSLCALFWSLFYRVIAIEAENLRQLIYMHRRLISETGCPCTQAGRTAAFADGGGNE
jgi:hypothetical protein